MRNHYLVTWTDGFGNQPRTLRWYSLEAAIDHARYMIDSGIAVSATISGEAR